MKTNVSITMMCLGIVLNKYRWVDVKVVDTIELQEDVHFPLMLSFTPRETLKGQTSLLFSERL